ncbi:MAG: helix-turn-helix transcriptional regulator [Bacteroidales bacterium]|nr:helix-turn-helix transcriptional regulator [Bacteroidales bacterium]
MKERLVQLMSHLGLTAARFADEIGVQRSGISHILSGRNQPGYDFILKTLLKFPDIDSDWLLTGRGNMLKSDISNGNPLKSIEPIQDPVTPVRKSKEVTNVNFIEKVIILHKDGTFDHYDPARKD